MIDNEVIEVRAGEEFDVRALENFLSVRMGREVSGLRVKQFPSGNSNLTYTVSVDEDEFVLRRPPFGNRVKSAHDMSREFEVLTALSTVYKPAPKPFLYCGDESVIGNEFYLMERRHGIIIRGKWPYGDSSTTLLNAAAKAFIDNLAELHAVDYKTAGLAGLGKPAGYTRRQVEGWSSRYMRAKTDDWPEIERVISWLNERIPDDDAAALVHNDYKFDNIMLNPDDPTDLVAVLDWEMATIGSPLMDLGTTLGYWMSDEAGESLLNMPFNPRLVMENVTRDELVGMYANASNRDVSNIEYYYIFGTFKIAVIAQQIYHRYKKGFTSDKRFANFNAFVSALGKIAFRATR